MKLKAKGPCKSLTGATTRIENSSEKKKEDAVKSIEGVEKNDESKGHEHDGSISGYRDLEPSDA